MEAIQMEQPQPQPPTHPTPPITFNHEGVL